MTQRKKNQRKEATANVIWGGRFADGPAQIMEEINASISFDQRLYRQDIAASKAHAAMLAAQGIISASDSRAISEGLDIIISEIETGIFPFSTALEDIHMNVEARLKNSLGNLPDVFIRPGREMIRWRPTSGSGCGTLWMG